MVNPVGVVVQRGMRVLLLCVLALVSAACGDDKCDGGGMPAFGCPFFAEDGTVLPERMEHVRRVATPVEVNGDFSEAELVRPTAPVMSAVFLSFPVEQDQRYRFSCQGITLAGCAVHILDGAGRVIASPPRFGSGGPEGRLAFRATEEGTWYAMVTLSSTFLSDSGTFRYRLQGFGLDAHGDSPEEASLLSPSPEPFPGGLQGPGDQDVFAFAATAGNVYALTCEGPGDSIPWRLSLAGGELHAFPAQGQARLAFEAETSGTMFVSISYDEAFLSPEEEEPEYPAPGYTCRFEALGPDDHGDANDRATALDLPVSELAGNLEAQGDRDVFSLQLVASHYYQVSCVPVGSGRCEVLLAAEAGAQPWQAFGGSSWKPRSTGTHFLRVSGDGAYRLSVEDRGLDAHGETKEEATLLTVSETPGQGSFQVRDDVDAFAFDAQPDGIYELTCEWAATGPQDVLRMEWSGGDATGGGFSSASRSFLAVEPRVATRITVLLSGPSASTPRPYTCVLRTRQDDHGDSLADAAALSFPASFTTRTDLPLDTDFLRFAVEADHVYRFTCADAAAPCAFRLFNENSWPMHSSQAPDRMFIEHAPAQAGVVYLEVRGPLGVVLSVTATDLGPDDHGDDRATATPISIGVPVRVYVPFEDPDVLRFEAAPLRYYRVRCVRPDGTLSRFCSVSSPSDPFFTGTRTEQGVLVKMPEAGPLFITIHGRNEPGEHTVTVEDLGPDDHGDRATEATPLTLGVPMEGALEMTGDKDVVSVELAANEPRQALFPAGVFVLVMGPGEHTRSLDAEGRFTTWTAGRYTLHVTANSANGYPMHYQLELR
ncbi:hypothetical protein [Pyxidicoccus trucidator]|uniref:hypothetical protein n=1 Tax=Pyxidicoccus trucidator TaxID=2709662 RepID=UPI0013DC9DDD|nr:hypothetical protein [Pyxidicoccus trucidator]